MIPHLSTFAFLLKTSPWWFCLAALLLCAALQAVQIIYKHILIKQSKDTAEVASFKEPAQYHPVFGDIVQFIEETSSLYATTLPKGQTLEIEAPDGHFDVKFDKEILRRLIAGLLDEMFRNCGEGGKVTMTVRATDGCAEVTASENGYSSTFTIPFRNGEAPAQEGEGVSLDKKIMSRQDREFLAKIESEIEQNMQDSEYTIEELCAKMGISRSSLYKKLMRLTGRSPIEYIRIKRLQEGRAMLDSGETSVSQVAWSVGFSPKQFSKYFKDEYGCLPSEYIHDLTY